MAKSVLDKIEKIVGKEENAGYQHFLLFPQCFQKAFYLGYLGPLKVGIWQQRVNPFPNKPWFSRVCYTSLYKTPWEKEKLLVTSNFSFSHNVFLPFWRTSRHFPQIKNCCLQPLSVWKSLKFVV